MANKGRLCAWAVSPSGWVHRIYLTCDNHLVVTFARKGVPYVTCRYDPLQGGNAEALFEAGLLWQWAGEWVHQFLYKKVGYTPVAPPDCATCDVAVAITSSMNPAPVGIVTTFTATVTNEDGHATLGEAPYGSVEFAVDGVAVCTVALAQQIPPASNFQEATCEWTCDVAGEHFVAATFTPAEGSGFSTAFDSLDQTCTDGVATDCCPGEPTPTALTATFTGALSAVGSIPLTYNAAADAWDGSGSACGVGSVRFECTGTGTWIIALGPAAFAPDAAATSCAPFSWTSSGTALGVCAGAFTVTVTE